MLFTTGILLASGSTLLIAGLDKLAENYGFVWIGLSVKLLFPIAGLILGVYFLEHNPMLHWIGL